MQHGDGEGAGVEEDAHLDAARVLGDQVRLVWWCVGVWERVLR